MTATQTNLASADVSLAKVQALIARHIPLYTTHAPIYQTALLQAFRALWDPAHARVLDVGGGTGIIAQAMKELFGLAHVTSVDVEDRFLKSLDIETRVYDGHHTALCGRLVRLRHAQQCAAPRAARGPSPL